MKKAIDYILSIDTFEHKCDEIKCMLQASRLEDHTETIGIEKLLSTRSSFEHKFLNNIKKVYHHAGKCNDQ